MRFSVLSYNVLHGFGASRLFRGRAPLPGGGGGEGPAWARDRLAQAAELVRRLDPDVACLQEVDEAAHGALARALGAEAGGPGGGAFECAAWMRNEDLPARDGCALFVRRARFEVVEAQAFRLRDAAGRHFEEEARLKAGGLAAALWRELHEKLNLALCARVRAKECGGAELCVATAHLYWDPQYPDLKLLQAFLLARELERFAGNLPLVLAGDLNSTPFIEGAGELSGVYGLLTQGRVAVSHPHHPAKLRQGRGILRGVTPADVPELAVRPFRSAYWDALGAEGPITNAARDFRGCLDYILYRGGGGEASAGPEAALLRVRGARALPSEEELAPQMPLPSAAHPSDHLPLLAEFELGVAE